MLEFEMMDKARISGAEAIEDFDFISQQS